MQILNDGVSHSLLDATQLELQTPCCVQLTRILREIGVEHTYSHRMLCVTPYPHIILSASQSKMLLA